jgi:hypothetical protein
MDQRLSNDLLFYLMYPQSKKINRKSKFQPPALSCINVLPTEIFTVSGFLLIERVTAKPIESYKKNILLLNHLTTTDLHKFYPIMKHKINLDL